MLFLIRHYEGQTVVMKILLALNPVHQYWRRSSASYHHPLNTDKPA